MTTDPLRNLDRTVNATVLQCPSTLPVFKAFGIDACCGGALTLRDAAARHRVDTDILLRALHAAAEVPA